MGTCTTILLLASLVVLASGESVRLMLQETDNTRQGVGRVELSINNRWGTVCWDLWDTNPANARVLCRSLGFGDGTTYTDVTAYGPGPQKRRIHLDNVICLGTESSLLECTHTTDVNCNHNQDVGVRCQTATIATPRPTTTTTTSTSTTATTPAATNALILPLAQQRAPAAATAALPTLQSTNTPLEIVSRSTDNVTRLMGRESGIGYVQVRHANGTYGYVCDDEWDWNAAKVVCASLDLQENQTRVSEPRLPRLYNLSIPTTVVFALDDVRCTGTEDNLANCGHAEWFVHNCNASEVAAVSCVAPTAFDPSIPSPELDCHDGYMVAQFDTSLYHNLTTQHLDIADRANKGNCTFSAVKANGIISARIDFDDCGTVVKQNASHIIYDNYLYMRSTRHEGPIYRVEEVRIFVCCVFPRNHTVTRKYEVVTQNMTVYDKGRFNVTMWIYETPKDLADSVRVLSYPYQTRVGDWLEFAVELHTVDERLKLVVTECTCWAGDTVDASKPSYALYNKNLNPCQRERTLELIPMDLTRFAFRYEAFAFTGYDIVTIECDAIVCLKTEATQECDRTCGGFKPPPAYGRRRRRRQAAGEHRIIRVFSGPVYVVNRHVQDSIPRPPTTMLTTGVADNQGLTTTTSSVTTISTSLSSGTQHSANGPPPATKSGPRVTTTTTSSTTTTTTEASTTPPTTQTAPTATSGPGNPPTITHTTTVSTTDNPREPPSTTPHETTMATTATQMTDNNSPTTRQVETTSPAHQPVSATTTTVSSAGLTNTTATPKSSTTAISRPLPTGNSMTTTTTRSSSSTSTPTSDKPVSTSKPAPPSTEHSPSPTPPRPGQAALTTGETASVTERPGQPAAGPRSQGLYVHDTAFLDQQNTMADQTPPSDTINTAPAVSAAPSVLILLLAIIWQAA